MSKYQAEEEGHPHLFVPQPTPLHQVEAAEPGAEHSLPWSERIVQLSIHPDAATRDDIARLAAELMEARSVPAADWMPIESAPKGQRVLVWRPSTGKFEGGWWIADWGKHHEHNYMGFTHWMPLPAPPKGER